jgi:hypothetical protein
MTTLLVIVAILIALVGLVLASWLHLEGTVDDAIARFRIRWAALAAAVEFRGRTIEVRLFGLRLVRGPLGGDPDAEPRRRDTRRRRRRRAAASPLAGFPQAWRFYRRQLGYLLGRVHVARLRAHLRVATPDPALTGVAYGYGAAAIYPLRSLWPLADLSIEPDFSSEIPGGSADLAVRVRIATLALVAWRVFWHERSRRRGRIARASEEGRSDHGTE